jgi:signal peptidase I
MKILSRSLQLLKEWIRFAFVTLVLFVLVRGFVLEAFTIPTASMERTLLVGDFLFVNKALYGAEIPGTHTRLPAIRGPERGDVVVFRPPHDRGRVYVKRVVGVAGDTLEMRDKTLFRNGLAQEEPYARYQDRRGDAFHPGMKWQSDFLAAAGAEGRYAPSRDNWGPLVVPPEKFFVMGDNRDNSEDSRYWGFIGREDISGTPWIVYLSLRREDEDSEAWVRRIRWERLGHRIH